MNCNEMGMQFMPFECVMKQLFLYWVLLKGFFFFFLSIGYEMGYPNMIKKGFGYEMCKECVIKFIPSE